MGILNEPYLKEVKRVLQGNFKGVSWVFEDNLSLLQVNLKSLKFYGCFKNISIRFCFAILLLKKEGLLIFNLIGVIFC